MLMMCVCVIYDLCYDLCFVMNNDDFMMILRLRRFVRVVSRV